MVDFTIGNYGYVATKMDARKQFHVARRLTPIFSELKTAFKIGIDAGDPMAYFEPVAQAISGMSDAESDYILDACLDVVKRKIGPALSPIRVSGRMMFEDMALAEMLQITWQVLQDNFASFFSAAPVNSGDQSAA